MEPRRTIDEWAALFELEPNFQHVFVEGEADQRILETLFDAVGRRSVAVRIVQEVELPRGCEETLQCPFSSGNRARLRIFGQEIQRQAERTLDNIRCVIDKDCDAILPFVADCPLIHITDFASLSASFIEYEPIRHAINTVYGYRIDLSDFCFVTDTAKYLTALRIFRYSFVREAHGVAVYKSIAIGTSGYFEFDYEDYVTRLAIPQGIGNFIEELASGARALLSRFSGDPRYYINYHDFISILFCVLRQRKGLPGGVSQKEIERVISATLSKERMLGVPLLKELADWAK
jgi:hypothetical protein